MKFIIDSIGTMRVAGRLLWLLKRVGQWFSLWARLFFDACIESFGRQGWKIWFDPYTPTGEIRASGWHR